MLCVVNEETDRLIGERRVETLRDVASALAGITGESEVLGALATVLQRNRKDLPFSLTYLFDRQEESSARLACTSGISSNHVLAPPQIEPDSDSPWPAHRVFAHATAEFVAALPRDPASPAGDWDKSPEEAVIVPIREQGKERPAGFFVAGINPYRRFDTGYSGFVRLLSGQIAAALGNARAWEAERRRAEALAEIDRAKTTFFSNVSHELRTPLTLMLSPVEELLAATEGDAGGNRELLQIVHRNGLRLQKLVNSLLDFARIEAGRMQAMFEPVDLAALTEDLAANFRSAMDRAGLRFIVDCQRCPVPVYVDSEMWEKIVLNLLSNALKFTFEGTVRISLRTSGGNVELEVEDTGTGISAAELPHIFERFHRVDGARSRTIEGTGIGLALVQELVRLHGGTISARSEAGHGSVFMVSLPTGSAHLPADQIRPAGAHARTSDEPADYFVQEALRWFTPVAGSRGGKLAEIPTPRTGERIVLADDNADMRDYVTRLLADRYQVIGAANGEDALAIALADPPDLVLSDVMMPGIGGFGLLAELRRHPETATVPVILLSARAGEESRVDGLAAGADDYLIKPFTARELLARVSAHLAMKKRREQAEQTVKESQLTLQSFYDSSPLLMGIAETDGDDILAVYSNRAAVEFLGADALMNGRKSTELGVPPEVNEIWREQYRRSLAQRAAVHFEYEHPVPSGRYWMRAVVHYLGQGPNGRPRFSYIAEDITEKRRAEDLLRRSNDELRRANADLEQFAYSASHDLQEPLRQVAVYSQLLEKKFGDGLPPKALEYLGWCVEGAHRMEMLVRDLLAYSQAGKTAVDSEEAVDLNAVLDNVRKNLATAIAESNATVEIQHLPELYIDAVPLAHVFQNLISNAMKYRGAAPPHIVVSADSDGPWWRFSVKDNGIGIPAEFRTQIFGIFKRLHNRQAYPGTGIGLAICPRIVERYGGRIWVESTEGQGSEFFFTMPKEQIT
jgi:PAS domain S-box-containing protein